MVTDDAGEVVNRSKDSAPMTLPIRFRQEMWHHQQIGPPTTTEPIRTPVKYRKMNRQGRPRDPVPHPVSITSGTNPVARQSLQEICVVAGSLSRRGPRPP